MKQITKIVLFIEVLHFFMGNTISGNQIGMCIICLLLKLVSFVHLLGNLVSLQQIRNSPNDGLLSRHSITGQNVQSTYSNSINVVFHVGNVLLYIDTTNMISNADHVLFIADNFQQPTEHDIFEFNQNQYSAEIKRMIESHDAKWISYQPEKNQNSNPLDTDQHTISSMERV